MGILIDSSVVIAIERGALELAETFSQAGDEPVAIAAITASELLHGVHRAKGPQMRTRRESFVERIFAAVPVQPFDMVAARVHAGLWAELAGRGVAVGPHDLLIAATAIALGYRVATRDKRSFEKIPGLPMLLW